MSKLKNKVIDGAVALAQGVLVIAMLAVIIYIAMHKTSFYINNSGLM